MPNDQCRMSDDRVVFKDNAAKWEGGIGLLIGLWSFIGHWAWGICHWSFIRIRLHLGHAQDFFGRGDTGAHQPPAILGKTAHTGAPRGFANLAAGTVLQNHLADFIVCIHPLEYGAPAMIAGLPAIP